MDEQIVKWGGIVGAIGTVVGVLVKWGKPIWAKLTKKKRDREDFQAKVLDGIASMHTRIEEMGAKIDDTQEDIAYLQMNDLKQTYARLKAQGWASIEEKQSVLSLYDRYKVVKGRNSLADSFKEDISRLPTFPPKNRRESDTAQEN